MFARGERITPDFDLDRFDHCVKACSAKGIPFVIVGELPRNGRNVRISKLDGTHDERSVAHVDDDHLDLSIAEEQLAVNEPDAACGKATDGLVEMRSLRAREGVSKDHSEHSDKDIIGGVGSRWTASGV